MTPRKLSALLHSLGLRLRRESGGFAIYAGQRRLWAKDVDEAFELALSLVEEVA